MPSFRDWPAGARLAHAVGEIVSVITEEAEDAARSDHVWMTLAVGKPYPVRLAINTLSRRNRDAGFDARIRVGFARMTWDFLPARGVERWRRFDYEDIESHYNVFYESYDRQEVESLLREIATLSLLAEAWGEPYFRTGPGLHQIHSRRASCAVKQDIRGRDGALKLYYAADKRAELFLFKFCGQP